MQREMNILLVEDNAIEAEIFERALRKIGATGVLHRVKNGIEAIDFLRERERKDLLPTPFVVFVDVHMPGMDGHEFLEALRADGSIGAARVYMLSSSDHEDDVLRAYRHHVNGYIVKPGSSAKLCETLEALRNHWAACVHPL